MTTLPRSFAPLVAGFYLIGFMLQALATDSEPEVAPSTTSAASYFSTLKALCGEKFSGEMTFPLDGQDAFAGKELVAHFKSCTDSEIRVPFTVGADRSRTWVITKTEDGLRLKHDHRHADGSPDEVTNYGGDANPSGTALSQSFPADEYTKELIPAAATNVWTVSLNAQGDQLTYHLERHAKPRFTAVLQRVETSQ